MALTLPFLEDSQDNNNKKKTVRTLAETFSNLLY